MHKIIVVALTAMLLATASPRTPFLSVVLAAQPGPAAATPSFSVGPQYDTTHVYIAPDDFERFTSTPILPIHAAFRRRKSFLWKPRGFFR